MNSARSDSILSVVLGEDGRVSHHVDQREGLERAQAIADLRVSASFAPVGFRGPFILHLSIAHGRLVFDVRDAENRELRVYALSLSPFRRLIKDYQLLVDSYEHAIRDGRTQAIQAIDMGRRGLHDEGAQIMTDRLHGKIDIDFETARRLFTLLCVLHQRA
ncbi:UPF0262 family protein [Acetobacteraceae bacterium KSS8]|uniref:UPF0262 family protein n=1 Tax=Endosaccharibacter trunci TaxID=2812733 RepID=A0ABT1W7H5_9PROT|nr:UPF0262 family protein [Acetobacteraceae bacterium KSS8]